MRQFIVSMCVLPVLAAIPAGTMAEDAAPPRLHTNEDYVEDFVARSEFPIDDPMAVFAYVLNSLPAQVEVFPTENHYYFRFFHEGTRYGGNIKIDSRQREQGRVRFVYYVDHRTGWASRGTTNSCSVPRAG